MEQLPTYVFVAAVVVPILALLVAYRHVIRLFGIVLIPEDSMGIVNKKFVLFGQNKTLPDGSIIAQNGEAGIQADTLAPGVHFLYWPWQFTIRCVRFTNVPDGMVGVVSAIDGHSISDGRVLGRKVECDSFQDARDFLINGGERGPQMTVLLPGQYRVNTDLFAVDLRPSLEIPDNMIGIVTTKEGKALPTGEIAGREIATHNLFQNGQAFSDGGGYKGLQEQVILAGRYNINPLFATVELVQMTEVPIAHAGCVIAYVGEAGVDVTGDTFKHGNLVHKGKKGVWAEPLDPGKYPINTRTHRVEMVPTANVVLNWANNKTEAHNLDANLCTIKVRSKDGFDFTLDVSQIIHIPRNDAPRVVARFGTVLNLVTQVLEPTIGNYFRNASQDADALDFLSNRKRRQDEAKAAIKGALAEYNVGAVDTLIGDINPPPSLMKTLTDRKLAQEEEKTYQTQQAAQEKRQQLEQAKAQADTQATVVAAERQVAIADFDAQSAVKKAEGQARARLINADGDSRSKTIIAEGDAKAKTINAEADARVTEMTGAAEAGRIQAVGNAEAEVIQLKTNAVGSNNFAVIEIFQALAAKGTPLVPHILAGGGSSDGGGTLINLLLASLLDGKRGAGEVVPFLLDKGGKSGDPTAR